MVDVNIAVEQSPQVNVSLDSKFPAQVVGGAGIDISRSGAVYTFSLDFESLSEDVSIGASDRDNTLVAVWDEDTEAFSKVSLDTLLGLGSIAQAWDADLDAISALTTTGILARTGSGTYSTRTITGTAAEITLANGNGVSGDPTISLPAALTFTGKTITGGTYSSPILTTPDINGGTADSLTSLSIRDTSAAFDVTFAAVSSTPLAAGRTLTLDMVNAARTIKLQGNLDVGGTLTTAAALSLPAAVQGDLLYGSAAGIISALAKDATATRYLSNTGTTNNPAWAQVNLTNGVTGTLPAGSGGTGITALGTGVATALGVNVGSAGAFVTFNGAGGTPSSITLTDGTGLPLTTGVTGTLPVANGGTGITALGTGVATALGVNVGSAGAFVTFNGAGGTPSSLVLTSATGLPLSTGVTGDLPFANLTQAAAFTLLGNTTGSTADVAAFLISGLTNKSSPAGTDLILISDEAASHALKYSTIAQAIAAVSGITGPGSSTDNAVMRWDSTGGNVAQNSVVIADDSGNVSGVGTLASTAHTITSASATALTVGRLGATTPALQVDASTATSITGIKVKSAASAGGVAVSAIGETNVAMTLDAAGSGTLTLAGTSTGNIALQRTVALPSGHIFNWNSSDVTLTHASNQLTVAGGDFNASVSLTAGSATLDKVNNAVYGASLFWTASGSSMFSANGDAAIYVSLRGADGVMQYFYKAGSLVGNIAVAAGVTTYNSSSDDRLKDKFDQSGTDWGLVIDRIWAGDFEMKEYPGRVQFGIRAQQLYEYFPHAVTPPLKDGDPWMADYSKLAPLALWGVKDARGRIADLEARNSALEDRIAALESR